MRLPQPTIKSLEESINKYFSSLDNRAPVKISKVLRNIDLSPITKEASAHYNGDYHFKYPISAMMKATILMKMKELNQSQLIDYLSEEKTEALYLGFRRKHKVLIPNQRTFSHFLNYRLDDELRGITDNLAWFIRKEAEERGVIFEENIDNRKAFNNKSKRTIQRRKDEKLRTAIKFLKKNVYPHINLDIRHNAIYDKHKFLDLMTYIAFTNNSAESGSNFLKEDKPDIKFPNSDTLLYHLKKYENKESVEREFKSIFDINYRIAKARGLFRRKVDVAIDTTDLPFYGNKNTPMVLGIQPQRGTHHGYKYASICIVEKGIRFTLLALPIGQWDEIDEIFEKLIRYAKSKVKINRVYCDRWFYRTKTIKILKKYNLKFIIQAKKFSNIKRIIRENKGKEIIVDNIEISTQKCEKEVIRIFALPHRRDNKKKVVFATNIDVTESNAFLCGELFRRRWGIETSYRVKCDFRAKTSSKNYVIRLFHFLFSVMLYNTWVLLNAIVSIFLFGVLPKQPLITAKLFSAILYNPNT